MRAAIGTMLKVHRVVPVQIRPTRNPICITDPQRAHRVRRFQTERLSVLAGVIDVRHLCKRGLDAQVLRLEDERCGSQS